MKISLPALLTLGFLQALTPASQEPLPTFRTGVDIVELDVTVLDKDRRPVKGLTADDFTILDRGKPQPIVAFSAVDVPPPVSYPAPWMRDAPIDVVSNVENRRLVAIVMDDAYTDFNPDMAKRAKEIARKSVDELGPADLGSVIFTLMGRAQNFTSDRSRLLAAIESYVPKQRNGEAPLPCIGPAPAIPGAPVRHGAFGTHKCDIEALATVAEALSTASPGRKVVIFISGGRKFRLAMGDDAPDLTKLFRNLQRANITVFAFDARGLLPPGGTSADRRELPDPATAGSDLGQNESLYTFAANTGGRTIANTNDPQSHVAETFRESSSYYFIGFQTASDSHDVGLRNVEVRVNRPGVQVQTRKGYYPSRSITATREVVNGLPSGELAVHATAAVVAVPGQRDSDVILSARLELPRPSTGQQIVELSAIAIDVDGKVKGAERQRITIPATSGSDASHDLPAHLRVPPGRYIFQLSAKATDRTGGVAVDVDVPNFSKESLSASGLMLQRRPVPAIDDKALAALVPFLPTADRRFFPSDDVAVFLRIYQSGKDRSLPVRMSARVINERNEVASRYESTLETANFSQTRSADYEASLPLQPLVPGEYLLEIDAQAGERRLQRTARFTVVAGR